MRQIGYDATGLEMSPWVVDFAKSTFNIPVFLGPVENLDTSQQSFDVIALMDVLEHLPDPNATMRHCFNLLKPNGFLLLQLPQYKEDMVYEKLKQTNHPFLSQLKSDEHLYLFSERSVKALFQQLGSEHIYFEPAIFSHYDMFLVASKSARETNTPVQIETTLLESVQGRMALALLDLRKREQALSKAFEESEADRLARFQQIESLRKQFSTLPFLTRWYCKAKKFCERRT
jgi:SAM-dependent methyltransferase